jgi:ABC-type multidrug transport system fused ATPase/permease subunit
LTEPGLDFSVPVASARELPFAPPSSLTSRDVFRLLARVWPFVRPYRKHLLYLLLLSLPGVATGLLALTLIRVFFDVIGLGHPLKPLEARMLLLQAGAAREVVLWHACVFAGVLAMIATPCAMAAFAYVVWILQRISNLFRVNLYTRLQELSLKFHAEEKIGDAMFRMFQDSAALPSVIDGLVIQPLIYIPLLIGTLSWLLLYNYQIALIAMAIIPLNFALAWFYSDGLRHAFVAEREATAQATTRLEETLASIKTVKAFATEAVETGRYAGDNWNAFLAARRARLMLARYSVLTNTIRALATVAVAYLGARQVIDGGMGGITAAAVSLGVFQGEMAVIGRMSASTRSLTNYWGSLQDIVVAIARVLEMLSGPAEAVSRGSRLPPSSPQSLRFDHVVFGYEPDGPVLKDVSIEAQPGQITAIAGPSGAGKSTLIALIARFFDLDSGAIRLGSENIADFDLAAWRAKLSIAFQENPLFTANLRDNISYSRPHATARELAAAIRRAGLTEFVQSLPDGMETQLGEKGAKLSTGQAQRIGLARALLRDAQILLLDEPTSALDGAAEEAVMRGIREWVDQAPARLAIILTHRNSTAARADRVYGVDAGKVVEVNVQAPRP